MQLGGHFPLNRGDRKAAVAQLRKAARAKTFQIVAPEGTRSKTGQLQELKKGPFHMQRDLAELSAGGGALLLPVVLVGNYEAWPTGALRARMCRVRVELLEPLVTPDYEDAPEQTGNTNSPGDDTALVKEGATARNS
jgi:1-acyl-sn-glycerol-3-phosphate acyltransferase